MISNKMKTEALRSVFFRFKKSIPLFSNFSSFDLSCRSLSSVCLSFSLTNVPNRKCCYTFIKHASSQANVYPSTAQLKDSLPQAKSTTASILSQPSESVKASLDITNLKKEDSKEAHTPCSSYNASPYSSASSSPSLSISTNPSVSASNIFDCFIVGGGVTGTALLYSLATFTDLKRIGLCERRDDFAVVASSGKNNSQTIHCGDIETNYTLDKAKKVKRQADMLRNYATKLPSDHKHNCIARYPKMVLAVGAEECEKLKERFEIFRDSFPNMKLIGKEEIATLEPMVGMQDRYTHRKDEICAISIENEYSTINYHETAKSFAKFANMQQNDKKVSIHMRTEVQKIEQIESNLFKIQTNKGVVYSRYVVVSACGNSLRIAQLMGYAKQFSCLPIAGSFYFTNKNVLNGKVYTLQNPALPFAAVHGDPDIIAKGKTRFGPTALPLPMLERYNNSSIKDFLDVLNLDMNLIKVYLNLFKESTIRNYVLKNFLYEVPYLNKRLFLQDVRKIIPSLRVEDIEYANGYGGVRPQLIDKENRKLLLGEGKIKPDNANLIFNVTPSPGATTCLGNAEEDMLAICKSLNANFNQKKFNEMLLQGEYPVF